LLPFRGSWGLKRLRLSLLAFTAQALILADDGLEITADHIVAITKAAGVEVEPYWPGLFAKLFAKKSIEDLLSNVGSGELLDTFP
jgi:hypothetical protein